MQICFHVSLDNCGGGKRKFILRRFSIGRVSLHQWILYTGFVVVLFWSQQHCRGLKGRPHYIPYFKCPKQAVPITENYNFFLTIFEVTEYQRVTRNDGHKNAKGNYEEVVDTLPAYIYLIYN